MDETTPTFSDICIAVLQFSSGETNIVEANAVITTFLSLPDNAQLPTIAKLINGQDAILAVYGWKFFDRIIKNSKLKSEVRVEIEKFVEEHYSDKIDDENVCLMKASAIATLLATNFNEKTVNPMLQFMNSKSLNDCHHAALEIMIWKAFTCLTVENDAYSNNAKNTIRKALISKIIPNIVQIVESWRIKGDGGDKLFGSFAAFVRILPSTIQISGSTDAINYLFQELLLFIKNWVNVDQNILIEIIDSYIPLLMVRNKFMNDVLLTRQYIENFIDIWEIVDFENDTTFSQLSEAILSIINAFSDFLVASTKQRKEEVNEFYELWISSFRSSRVNNVRVLCQILRSLKSLVEATRGGHEKLFNTLSFFQMTSIFHENAILEQENFWNVSIESIRVVIRASNRPAEIISKIYGVVLEHVLSTPIEKKQSQIIFERFFKAIRSLSHVDYECGNILYIFFEKFTKKILEYRMLIPEKLSFINDIIFFTKLKSAISSTLFKSHHHQFALMDDMKLSLELLQLGISHQNREVVYNLSSYIHNIVDVYFPYMRKVIEDSNSSPNKFDTSTEDIVSLMAIAAGQLSPLQKVPLVECIILLDNTNTFAQEQIQWIRNFQCASTFDEFMSVHLGFNSDNPSDSQMSMRKYYRAFLTMLRAVFKRASHSERGELVRDLHYPFLKLMCYYNSWKTYQYFAARYIISLTKNENVLLGLEGCTTCDERVPVDINPNTFFESLGEILFLVAEYMVASGLRDFVHISPAKELFYDVLKPCVNAMGMSYRRWMTKGFRSMFKAFSVGNSEEIVFNEIISKYCQCSSQIIIRYSQQQNIPEEDLAKTNPNSFEEYHLVQRFAYDTAACTSQMFGNDENIIITDEGNVIYKRIEGKPFSELAEAVFVNSNACKTFFAYFTLFRNINFDLLKTYGKMISHFLSSGVLISMSKEVELRYYASVYQSICLALISNCDDEESIPILLSMIKLVNETFAGHKDLFYQTLQCHTDKRIIPPSGEAKNAYHEYDKWSRLLIRKFASQQCVDSMEQ